MKLAAKRIVFGKFLNAGQTCVAPDYLLVHREVKNTLVAYMRRYLQLFYGKKPLENPDYPKIINEKHFLRLKGSWKTSISWWAATTTGPIRSPRRCWTPFPPMRR